MPRCRNSRSGLSSARPLTLSWLSSTQDLDFAIGKAGHGNGDLENARRRLRGRMRFDIVGRIPLGCPGEVVEPLLEGFKSQAEKAKKTRIRGSSVSVLASSNAIVLPARLSAPERTLRYGFTRRAVQVGPEVNHETWTDPHARARRLHRHAGLQGRSEHWSQPFAASWPRPIGNWELLIVADDEVDYEGLLGRGRHLPTGASHISRPAPPGPVSPPARNLGLDHANKRHCGPFSMPTTHSRRKSSNASLPHLTEHGIVFMRLAHRKRGGWVPAPPLPAGADRVLDPGVYKFVNLSMDSMLVP